MHEGGTCPHRGETGALCSLLHASLKQLLLTNDLTYEVSVANKDFLGKDIKEDKTYMANHPSALKRQRQDKKRRLRNKSYRSTINTSVKKIFSSADEKDSDGTQRYYKEAIAHLDSAVTKGVLHRKTASRRISRLTKRVNALTF